MREVVTTAVVSHTKIESSRGIYERKLVAEIDGANEIIWLTDYHVNTVVEKHIDETHSIAINKNQLDELNKIVSRIESELA